MSHAGHIQPSMMVDRDDEHLRLLGLYHLIVAGINVLGLVVFIILPLLMGPSYLAAMGAQVGSAEDLQRKLMVGLILGGLMTFLYAMNGISLRGKRNRISCIIMSVVECLNFPLGMLLGISAIVVLRRESVKAKFAAGKVSQQTA